MRKIQFLTVLQLLAIAVAGQPPIEGIWYSEDRKRVYEISVDSSGVYNALLKETKRQNDKPGAIILKGLRYHTKQGKYSGYIYSVKDGSAVLAIIKLSKDNRMLLLKLPRMFFMPVRIRWHR